MLSWGPGLEGHSNHVPENRDDARDIHNLIMMHLTPVKMFTQYKSLKLFGEQTCMLIHGHILVCVCLIVSMPFSV